MCTDIQQTADYVYYSFSFPEIEVKKEGAFFSNQQYKILLKYFIPVDF